ncbi:hypothetical protein BO70DRAFT_365537 [Aspergillus heteromorphus CBS 117.55]|uniref:HTH araC/xylS-type domain-containing protein n=1 Tax=Aspergillus heteromorphus CBS 117.55 TaxID=1448321 RepID=A0A317V840_9EURO|nr:uncharacterized protein BO70DRAFT_365537 [Aspergillus heteromorphus CBS 117.55]PWY70225.1 hypothetical protein BO70DRAFT_365537 [Aspergillus heteromorphus CBS 117.55]
MVQNPSPQALPRLPQSPTCATARWQAVVSRDPTAHTFVYAVLTTRIYCRPSCPARLARQANVRFYDTPSQAERAGFRPCKRCKPDSPGAINPQTQLVRQACQAIRSIVQAGSKPTLQDLAAEAGLTPSHFHRVFKKVMGVTPGGFVAEVLRGGAVAEALSDGHTWPEKGRNPTAVLQPCVADTNGDADSGGLENNGVDGADGAVLWNEFDAMIAAEAGFVSMQDVQPLDELVAWHGVGYSNVAIDETSPPDIC